MKELTESERLIVTKYDLLYEQRLTKVETICEILVKEIKEVKTDIRWLIGIMLGCFAGLFAMMAHGFKWF